jgi:HSP90 family molecular chaperone
MIQQRKVKEQRIKYLKDKHQEIFGEPLTYANDQRTIDFILNKYPTDEDILRYLQDLKAEDDAYFAREAELKRFAEEEKKRRKEQEQLFQEQKQTRINLFQELASRVVGHSLTHKALQIPVSSIYYNKIKPEYIDQNDPDSEFIHYGYDLPYDLQEDFLNEIKEEWE